MKNSEITIKITKQEDDTVKTTVLNEAGDDAALQIMAGVIKLFLNDQQAMATYAHLVRSYLETEAAKDKEANNVEQ